MTLSYLAKLCEERDDAEERVYRACEKLFMSGSGVTWMMGRYVQYGTVVSTSCDRVKVRNTATGKEFLINLPRILEAAVPRSRANRPEREIVSEGA